MQLISIPNHPQTAQTHLTIGIAFALGLQYGNTNDNDDRSMYHYEKALAIYEKNSSHFDVARTLQLIGTDYGQRAMYNLSMSRYKKALSLRLNYYAKNDLDLATLYHSIGSTYEDGFQAYTEALNNYEKALVHFTAASLPPDDSKLIETENDINRVKELISSTVSSPSGPLDQ
ncbi:unnamed protein product [Didymodactylos carnosus]|uniref:Uncharacterized protein n=1 Tax=Didymodactylos carnosus TaxID=1234261 RepID=A0A813Z1N8_9BILA|nr:unnamed protein product [Didymodactylos carnosus]CAF0892268.1 unnamed protein product [Didymodactylos carnosus]CAF3498967.1 unnamed protein product [Didymodactylos carnosus]CAF3676299.1 unnamed protein product [Didymodactylos carnosus]